MKHVYEPWRVRVRVRVPVPGIKPVPMSSFLPESNNPLLLRLFLHMQSDSGKLSRPEGPPPPLPPLQCPRCTSTDTKFCYFNNYNLSQPRHFCRSCRRYWTHGGALRNIPARLPTLKRSRSCSSPVTPPPQPPPSGGSFAGLLTNSQGSDYPSLEFDFGSDLEVGGSFGTWQFVFGEEVEFVEGAGFAWSDLTVSAPEDRFDPIKSQETGQI